MFSGSLGCDVSPSLCFPYLHSCALGALRDNLSLHPKKEHKPQPIWCNAMWIVSIAIGENRRFLELHHFLSCVIPDSWNQNPNLWEMSGAQSHFRFKSPWWKILQRLPDVPSILFGLLSGAAGSFLSNLLSAEGNPRGILKYNATLQSSELGVPPWLWKLPYPLTSWEVLLLITSNHYSIPNILLSP